MSVDLVGSTAFKADDKFQEYGSEQARPKWVTVFSDFYSEFPSMVRDSYNNASGEQLPDNEQENVPRLWKTIGDELILCNRVVSIEHAAHCVTIFLSCLSKYSKRLQGKNDYNLDVKGNAWVAAFPAPNIGIPLTENKSTSNGLETSEEIEVEIDKNPQQFDFLGKAIDTGFRISGQSSHDHCTLSAQLGYLLAKANIGNKFSHNLEYDGRASFKGVNNGLPYPIIYIDTETRLY